MDYILELTKRTSRNNLDISKRLIMSNIDDDPQAQKMLLDELSSIELERDKLFQSFELQCKAVDDVAEMNKKDLHIRKVMLRNMKTFT